MRRKVIDSPLCVGARMDWLELMFRVVIDPKVRAELKRRHDVARREQSSVAVLLAGRTYSLRCMRFDGGLYRMHNELCRLEVNEKAPGGEGPEVPGWTVRFAISGTELLATGWRTAVQEAWEVAEAIGHVVEARFGRMDLCCDVANYHLAPKDRESFVKRRRVTDRSLMHDGKPRVKRKKKTTTRGEEVIEETATWHADGRKILDDDEAGHIEIYGAGDTITGFMIGSRETVSCRIYDKILQLRTRAPDSLVSEYGWWESNGWDGKAPVTRVEFQVSGEALAELSLRLPLRGEAGWQAHAGLLGAALDGLWAYLTRKWFRLVRRQDKSVEPRWRVVQEAVFVAAAEPRERKRVRGGAKAAQAQGAMYSLLGSQGALPDPSWPARVDESTGEVDTDRQDEDELDLAVEYVAKEAGGDGGGAAARRRVEDDLREAALAMVPLLVDYQVDRAGGDPVKALAHVWTKHREAIARFPLAKARAAAAPPDAMAQSA